MPRSYGQVCGIAHAMDLLGERWTLLIIRELLLGPKRFGALESALTGIGPNLLSARLGALIEHDMVERAPLAPPASTSGYRLTARGEGLREPVEALAVWGLDAMEPEAMVEQGDVARGSWLASSLAARATRAGRTPAEPGRVVNFDVDGDRFHIRVGADRVHVRHGERDDAAASIKCDMRSFYEMSRGARPPGDPAAEAALAALAAG